MRDLPDAAVTEAVKAAWDSEYAYARNRKPDGGGHTMPHRDVFYRMLVAAAPVIAAAATAESATAERERWLAADGGTAAVYHLGAHDERKAILAAVSELLQRPHTGKDIADLIRARGGEQDA